jgi:phage-related tail protein
LYRKWKPFHDLVNDTWSWIKSHWPLLVAILIGPFAVAAYFIIKYWKQIWGFITRVYDAIVGKIKDIAGAIAGIWGKIPGHGILGKVIGFGAKAVVPGLAEGGTITRSGITLVGERGPELLSLPRGAKVVPHDQTERFNNPFDTLRILVYPQDILLDGKKIGEALATVVTSKEARQ